MAFEVSYEAVEMMRDLAKKIPDAVEAIHLSNAEVITCYESVQSSLGPHTKKIESIVHDIEKMLKKNADIFSEAANSLIQQANRAQRILDMKYKFKEDLKVDVKPLVRPANNANSSSGDPTIGALNRNRGNQTEYEH